MTRLRHGPRRSNRRRPWRCVLAVVCFAFLAYGVPVDVKESEVKAAFLLNFTRFVDWPPSAFESATSPLTICILGDDPFGVTLDQLVEGEVAEGRKLAVARIHRLPAPGKCQVLFVAKSEKEVPSTMADIGPGVLTVSDRDRFLNEGGIIAFVVEAGHVRFDISQRAAMKSSLALNARLLRVARSVQK